MANRRDKPAADAFAGGEEATFEAVANALYGKNDRLIEQVDRERVVRRVVSLKEIYDDPAIQVRVGGLNEEHVEALAQVLVNGGAFKDPIRLFRDDDSGRLYLSDGFHRVEAYKRALEISGGHEAVEPLIADIQPGGYAAAVEDAEEHNLTHGLKLSAQDKFNIFKRRFERGHEWTGWSNVLIGAALGVAEGTVRNWRTKFYEGSKSRSQDYEPQRAKVPEKRVGADGKSYPIRPSEPRAKPRGVTLPPQRRVTDEYSQVHPEEPALDYDYEDGGLEGGGSETLPRVADLHVPAVPDSYDADRETAIRTAALLEGAALEIQQVRGIRSFYKLDRERLASIDLLLFKTLEHIERLRERIDVIYQTGQPYEDDADWREEQDATLREVDDVARKWD